MDRNLLPDFQLNLKRVKSDCLVDGKIEQKKTSMIKGTLKHRNDIHEEVPSNNKGAGEQ